MQTTLGCVCVTVTAVKAGMDEFVMQRSQMPQEIALHVETFFTVGTEKWPFARVSSLMDHHGCMTWEYFLTNVA